MNTTRVNATCLPFYNVTLKSTLLTCNYTNATNSILAPENCSCINITVNGKSQLNCSCCLKNNNVIVVPPVPTFTCPNNSETTNCTCKNITSLKSWSYNCDCVRRISKDTTQLVTNITNLTPQNCSCYNGNLSNCSCCLIYTSVPFTCGINSTRYNATCLPFFNITSKINSLLCNYTNATNTVLAPENCSCINVTVNGKNQLNCTCCVKNVTVIVVPPVPVFKCTNDTESVNCTCQNVTSLDKKSWSYTCDCVRRINKITT